MKKQIIAIASIIIVTAVIFTSCGTKYKTYVDDNGIPHVLVTDEEGNSMVNDNGQIIVAATDESGDLITDANGVTETRYAEFPSLVINDKTIETPHYKLTLPENWGFKTGRTANLIRTDSSVCMDIIMVQNTTYEKAIEDCRMWFKAIDDEYDTINGFTEEQTTVNNSTAIAIKFSVSGQDPDDATKEKIMTSYIFQYAGVLYHIPVTATSTEDFNNSGFENVIDLIEFR